MANTEEMDQENLISEVQQFLRSKKVSKYLKKHDMVVTLLFYAHLSPNTKILFAVRTITQYSQPQYFSYYFQMSEGTQVCGEEACRACH